MRKLIVSEFVSLDGVMEARRGASRGGVPRYRHARWTFDFPMDKAQMKVKLDETMDAESLLLGRNPRGLRGCLARAHR